MNVALFQALASNMLMIHYGLELNDTELHQDAVVAECIKQGFRPYQVLNEHAEECGLDRIGKEAYGGFFAGALTSKDEIRALRSIGPIETLSDQPTTCMKCGSRTEFDDLEDKQQHHYCLNPDCGHEFIAEP